MVTEKSGELCTGCGVCSAICPKKCLTIELDSDGFYKAVCDEKECVKCGLCDKVCPKFMNVKSQDVKGIYSFISKDEQTLKTTSSGGLCYEIAKKVLLDGKKVCACIYDYEKHRAEHTVIADISALDATKGSKYFQSYTADAFSKIFDGDEWVVFGTPCQIAAIDVAARAKNIRDSFLLVDFFCHGTPSMNLWKKYIAENNPSEISKIDFRSKEFGWHSFSLKFTYQDGNSQTDYKNNMFYNFFFGHYCLGESCHACKFKALSSAADIRVGDFWGEKYQKDKTGVSCCVAFTEEGNEMIEILKSACSIQEEKISEVLKAQMAKSPIKLPQRKKVLKALRGKRSLKSIFNTTLFFYRAKCKINSILGRK